MKVSRGTQVNMRVVRRTVLVTDNENNISSSRGWQWFPARVLECINHITLFLISAAVMPTMASHR